MASQSLKEMRDLIGDFVINHPDGSKLWDILTGLRGPDSPSETPSMTPAESQEAYRARRERKARTVEVIRWAALNGKVGGSARYRTDRSYVELPPPGEWDHFDKHVARAAASLGIEVRTLNLAKRKWEVKAEIKPPKDKVKVQDLKVFKNQGLDHNKYPPTPWSSNGPLPLMSIDLGIPTQAGQFTAIHPSLKAVYDALLVETEEEIDSNSEDELDEDDIPF